MLCVSRPAPPPWPGAGVSAPCTGHIPAGVRMPFLSECWLALTACFPPQADPPFSHSLHLPQHALLSVCAPWASPQHCPPACCPCVRPHLDLV